MLDKRLKQAACCLPPVRATELGKLNEEQQKACEEIRLRAGQAMSVVVGGREHMLHGAPLTGVDLQDIVARACGYSMHTHAGQMTRGFITMQGGHRLGICGTAAVQNGEVVSFRTVSSLNLRVARQIFGVGDGTVSQIVEPSGRLASALVLAPPGRGKTTLLRDVSRQLSEQGCRVGIADERGELAALYHGMPQFAVGAHTDVMDGCPKATAAMMLVKTMSPQLVILDEITSEADVHAALYAAHCGVAVLASAHAFDFDDFCSRPLYRRVLDAKIFSRFFLIEQDRTVKSIK